MVKARGFWLFLLFLLFGGFLGPAVRGCCVLCISFAGFCRVLRIRNHGLIGGGDGEKGRRTAFFKLIDLFSLFPPLSSLPLCISLSAPLLSLPLCIFLSQMTTTPLFLRDIEDKENSWEAEQLGGGWFFSLLEPSHQGMRKDNGLGDFAGQRGHCFFIFLFGF